jgi:hypothetical protein
MNPVIYPPCPLFKTSSLTLEITQLKHALKDLGYNHPIAQHRPFLKKHGGGAIQGGVVVRVDVWRGSICSADHCISSYNRGISNSAVRDILCSASQTATVALVFVSLAMTQYGELGQGTDSGNQPPV